MPDIDREKLRTSDRTYKVSVRCANCGHGDLPRRPVPVQEVTMTLPKGTPLDAVKCPRCECTKLVRF